MEDEDMEDEDEEEGAESSEDDEVDLEEQETVQVNEDKGEDKPGGCHSSPVPIFRLYL
jgi:hypothetical protein